MSVVTCKCGYMNHAKWMICTHCGRDLEPKDFDPAASRQMAADERAWRRYDGPES